MDDESLTTEDVFGQLDDLDLDPRTPTGFSPVGLDSGSWQAVDESVAATSPREILASTSQVENDATKDFSIVSAPDVSQGREECGSEKRSVRDWSLTDFSMDPDAQIWLPHLGRAQRQGALKQPWETSPVAKVFEAAYCQPPKYHRCGFADALMGVSTKTVLPEASGSFRSPPEFIARRLRFASLSRDEDLVRRKCLQKLRSMILMDPPASQLGASLLTAAGSLVDEEEVTQSFKDAFSVKSTATLSKRLAALWPYAKWSLSTGRTPLNLDEAKVYEYLTHMRNQKCSASAPSSFMEAVGFLHSIVDLKTLKGMSSFSGRCKGLAKDHLATRAKRKQAPPLTVEMVSSLETYVGTNFRSHKAVVAGHILFCVYSCARWADSIRLTEIESFHRGRIAIVETATEHHKSALTDEAKALFLPFLCLGAGLVEGYPWSTAWLASRKVHKVGRPFTWAAITSWSDKTNKFTATPMSSTEASLWLREILEEVGYSREVTETVSSHSLKSTLLSWSAKSGKFTDPQRRQMGHHFDPQDRSMLVYSRDAYAPIAVATRLMLDDIVAGKFDPDLPRIDRIAKAVEDMGGREEAETSSSSDNDEMEAHSPSTKLTTLPRADDTRHPDVPYVPTEFLMVHRLSGVMHVSATDSSFACGRKINSSYVNWSSNSFENVDTDICTQCRTKASLHFTEEGSEQYEPTSEEMSE